MKNGEVVFNKAVALYSQNFKKFYSNTATRIDFEPGSDGIVINLF